MLNILPYLFVLVLGAEFSFPPPTQINADSLFGIQEITIRDSVLDEFIIDKIKTIRHKENGSKFVNYCHIIHEYSFRELPFLKLYLLDSGDSWPLGGSYPYNYLLFNKSDSSLYHFGGDEKTFTQVIKPTLSEVIKENRFLDLIKLYLYSLDDDNLYYALESIQAYENIWQAEIEHFKGRPYKVDRVDPENIKNDLSSVKNIFKPILIEKGFWSTIVQIYSWEWEDGKVELWEFSISKRRFKVKSRQIILQFAGPHSWRHHH